MFEENKVWKKFTSVFKGLKRCHPRAKKPNKITEYEVPRDPTKFNRKIEDFDPGMLFEMEYARDEEKKRRREEELYGPRPDKEEVQVVKVQHLNALKQENRVLSIFEELNLLAENREFTLKKEETVEEEERPRNLKEEFERKKITDMVMNMQMFDNGKL